MPERSFNRLPEDVQTAVIDAGRAAIAQQRKAVAAAEAEVVQALVDKGMEINSIDDVGAFREKVGPVYKRFEPTIGADLLNSALEAVSSN